MKITISNLTPPETFVNSAKNIDALVTELKSGLVYLGYDVPDGAFVIEV